jgi:UDP-N-acetylglucosamine 2-epimerase (non-hydrolysing)
MKAAPVIEALDAFGVPQRLVHTGQHYDRALSAVFFEQLEMPEPDSYLGVGSSTQASQTAALLEALEPTLIDMRPSMVVVYGDVNSTLAAALVASKLGIPVAHVEAGLRSFDRSMPEEINRIVADALASLHFVTSPEAIAHLADEGISEASIHFVGNPMIDTLEKFRPYFDPNKARSMLGIPESYGVITLHRPSNVDDLDRVEGFVKAFADIASRLPLVFPVHPRGRNNFEEAGLTRVPGVRLVEPLPYVEFLSLVAGAKLVITDSGGLQEETTVLGVPCLTARDNTERPITVRCGTNRLVGSDPGLLPEAVEDVLGDPPRGRIPPLWDGEAGRRIAEVLAQEWKRREEQ